MLSSTSEMDVLFGTTGYQDQFVFTANSNQDTIIGFTAGIDDIDLSALSFVDSNNIGDFLMNNVASVGTDILITLDGTDTITLRNVASLQASDFIVHAA
jgi:hypothetical protein